MAALKTTFETVIHNSLLKSQNIISKPRNRYYKTQKFKFKYLKNNYEHYNSPLHSFSPIGMEVELQKFSKLTFAKLSFMALIFSGVF